MNILICTPCYQAAADSNYMQCLLNLIEVLKSKGIGCELFSIGSESLITRGRNACVAKMLSDPKYTHLLFIDADIAFNPMTVLRMLDINKPVTAAIYPKKRVNFERMAADYNKLLKALKDPEFAKTLKPHEIADMTPETYQLRYADYVYNVMSPNLQVVNGFAKVSEAGTGFLMIKRQVFELLVKKYPNMKYTNDVEGYNAIHPNMKDNFYLFFDCSVDPDSKRYLSEDYAFCRLWGNTEDEEGNKGEIWADTTATLYHIGKNAFMGNLISTWALSGYINASPQ